jgi:hypothetical protein
VPDEPVETYETLSGEKFYTFAELQRTRADITMFEFIGKANDPQWPNLRGTTLDDLHRETNSPELYRKRQSQKLPRPNVGMELVK